MGHMVIGILRKGKTMNHRVEFTWKSLAEASEEATRKFTWVAVGLFLACGFLTYYLVNTHVRYNETCEYISANAPAVAVQRNHEEAEFARSLLQRFCT